MHPYPKFSYLGGLPTGSATTNIFSTVVAFPMARAFQLIGIHRMMFNITNDQAGTLNAYNSVNRGVTWTQVDQQSVSASASNAENIFDYLVEPYSDWKLDWVNGGTNQGTFVVHIIGQGQRVIGN